MVSTRISVSNANDAHTNNANATIDANTNTDDGNDANASKANAAEKAKDDPFRSSHATRNAAGSLTFSRLSSKLLLRNSG